MTTYIHNVQLNGGGIPMNYLGRLGQGWMASYGTPRHKNALPQSLWDLQATRLRWSGQTYAKEGR